MWGWAGRIALLLLYFVFFDFARIGCFLFSIGFYACMLVMD
jgi:hypothetical protein